MYEGQAEVLNEADFADFIAFLGTQRHSERNIAICQMGYRSGQRIGSISALQLNDVVNARDGSIKTTVVLKRQYTKNSKTTTCFFTHPELIKCLTDYLKVRPNIKGVDALFINQQGRGFSANTMTQLVYNLFHKAGYTGCSSHSLRRSFSTNQLEGGCDLLSLQALLNHSNPASTALYIKHNPARLAALVANTGK